MLGNGLRRSAKTTLNRIGLNFCQARLISLKIPTPKKMQFPFRTQYILILGLFACSQSAIEKTVDTGERTEFQYKADRFADLQILRYQVHGFDQLSVLQKKLAYYLTQAALSGRDIIWDQNYKHNLRIRRTIEAIIESFSGNRDTEDFRKFLTWAKRVWFSNGIHHHYSTAKMVPEISSKSSTSESAGMVPLEFCKSSKKQCATNPISSSSTPARMSQGMQVFTIGSSTAAISRRCC